MTERMVKASRERKKRIPVSSRDRLVVRNKDPNYEYRIVNDEGDRIQRFIDAGYDFVDASESPISSQRIVGSEEGTKSMAQVGNGRTAFLMRIPKEFYEEDQKAKMDELNAQESAIVNPQIEHKIGQITIK